MTISNPNSDRRFVKIVYSHTILDHTIINSVTVISFYLHIIM